jgi:hypothetical protein
MRRALWLVPCLVGVLEAPARAGEDKPPPSSQPQVQWAAPEVAPPDRTHREAALRTAVPAAATKPSTRESLASMQAVSVKEGEARVRLPGGERTLRAGDPLGADRVRTVADGLIVLDRPPVPGAPGAPGAPGGAATVIVRFDASGRARVRVLYESNPTPPQVPEVR